MMDNPIICLLLSVAIQTRSQTAMAVILLVASLGCGQPNDAAQMPPMDMSGHEQHVEESRLLEPGEPAGPGMSLYQMDTPWTDQDGESRQLASLAGTPRVVAMTYTSCKVSCPVIVADMKRIESTLMDAGVKVGFVLLSLDPDRDTPHALAAYMEDRGLSKRWTLLTAPADDVMEMSMLLGVRYRRLQDGEFAHSNMLTILDASGVVVHQQKGLGPDLSQSTIDFLSAL